LLWRNAGSDEYIINILLIKCKVKNFMDINRALCTEKYV